MMALAGAGLGWTVGTAVPGSHRRLRIACAAAALVPGLDALVRLAHPPGVPLFHNFFAGLLCIGVAAWVFRGEPARSWLGAVSLVGLCYALSLGTDTLLGGELRLFWPLSARGRAFAFIAPGSRLPMLVSGLFLVLPWALAFWKQATPLEILSPRLDALVVNLFRRRNRQCEVCGKPCNNRCAGCTHPVCLRHLRIRWGFRVSCPTCAAKSAPKGTGAAVEDYIADQLRFLRSKEAVRLDPEFASFLHRRLTDGLRRLDDVPRTHPLWQGSDGRPTLAKLVDLSRTVLKDAPDDEQARWVLFADRIFTSSPDLEYPLLEPVLLADLRQLRWLVASARWTYVFSGVDPVVALRAPLQSLEQKVGSLETCLGELKNDKDTAVREAADRCLELFRGKNPFKASGVV